MVRSAAAILAVLILPGLALAQAPERSHTVVDDDTLWDLAVRYYENPWEWRAIWEANRSQIQDPNLIYPNQVFVIPGLAAQQQQTAQATPAPAPATPPSAMPAAPPPMREGTASGPSAVHPADVRTIFYQNEPPAPSVVEMLQRDYMAVEPDRTRGAPWLLPPATPVDSIGTVTGPAHEVNRGSSLRQFQQIRLRTDAPLRVGSRVRLFREQRTIPQVGRVLMPTGLATVTAIADSGAVAVIDREYARIAPGDLVGPVPEITVEAGRRAVAVQGGTEAMIMAFDGRAALHDLGHHAFLDVGSDDGISVGDEFVLFSDVVTTEQRGALQVVAVTPFSATARITYLADDVFETGVIVRLVRAMQ